MLPGQNTGQLLQTEVTASLKMVAFLQKKTRIRLCTQDEPVFFERFENNTIFDLNLSLDKIFVCINCILATAHFPRAEFYNVRDCHS